MTSHELHARNFYEIASLLMLVVNGLVLVPMFVLLLFGGTIALPALIVLVLVRVGLGFGTDRYRLRVFTVALLAAWTYCLVWQLAVALATLGALALLPSRVRAVLVPVFTAGAFAFAGSALDFGLLTDLWWLAIHPLLLVVYLNYFALMIRDLDAPLDAPRPDP